MYSLYVKHVRQGRCASRAYGAAAVERRPYEAPGLAALAYCLPGARFALLTAYHFSTTPTPVSTTPTPIERVAESER
jgi:hypothetical protein